MGRAAVSILLPSLNVRKFLGPRVDSLLNQTFTDWEAIVLDSHSTDGTWEFFQSVAETDPRFHLHQIPREGLYPALNRGLKLMTGEFLYVAPCDDTMAPEFLAEMVEALAKCPDAGIAVCDCLFINPNGDELHVQDMTLLMSKRRINNLLRSGSVRTSLLTMRQRNPNYRPPPHDCLLHFTGRSVYFSLTQLLIRTASAKAAGFFETNAGSAADFGWLVRLTSLTGSVHLPKKLATWRFHGDQLSLQRDNTRLSAMNTMCESILQAISGRYPSLLTNRDRRLLMLPYKALLARSLIRRIGYWLEGFVSLWPIFAMHPVATLRTLSQTGGRAGMSRNFPIATVLHRTGLAPRNLGVNS